MEIGTCFQCEETKELDMLGRCQSCYQEMADGVMFQSVLDKLVPKMLEEAVAKKYSELMAKGAQMNRCQICHELLPGLVMGKCSDCRAWKEKLITPSPSSDWQQTAIQNRQALHRERLNRL